MTITDCIDFPLNETTTLSTIVNSLGNRIDDLICSEEEKNAILQLSIEIVPLFADIISSYVQVEKSNDYAKFKSVLLGAVFKFGEALNLLINQHLVKMSIALGLILVWVPIVNRLVLSEGM